MTCLLLARLDGEGAGTHNENKSGCRVANCESRGGALNSLLRY